tara:strand:+ start:458 stop:646 length:189 start_codon:yes stop_codon:yes gene_type:complete
MNHSLGRLTKSKIEANAIREKLARAKFHSMTEEQLIQMIYENYCTFDDQEIKQMDEPVIEEN